MMEQRLNLVTEKSKTDYISDVYFDLTLIINKDNKPMIIDNSVNDWKDFVDCGTLITKQIKVRP